MAAHLWAFGIFLATSYRRFYFTKDTDKLTRQLNAGLEAIGTERFEGFGGLRKARIMCIIFNVSQRYKKNVQRLKFFFELEQMNHSH